MSPKLIADRQVMIIDQAARTFLEAGGDAILLRACLDEELNRVIHQHHAGPELAELELSGSLLAALGRNNVHDLLTLLQHTRQEVYRMPGINEAYAVQIERALWRHGLRLKEGPHAQCI